MPNIQQVRAEVRRISRSYNGPPIEKGIFDLVVALRYCGLNTSGSCEGHLDTGLPYPWVNLVVPKNLRNKKGLKRWKKSIVTLESVIHEFFEPREYVERDEYLSLDMSANYRFVRLVPRGSSVLENMPRELIPKATGIRMLKRYRRIMKEFAHYLIEEGSHKFTRRS